MNFLEKIESEDSIVGASIHIMAIGKEELVPDIMAAADLTS